ncbi:hypothetical protein BC828DRAFT_390420 [Blastocladiella britannica]|nr:hypothetical protein BC828DRAFT_390420 [Blastocladiella britannica]
MTRSSTEEVYAVRYSLSPLPPTLQFDLTGHRPSGKNLSARNYSISMGIQAATAAGSPASLAAGADGRIRKMSVFRPFDSTLASMLPSTEALKVYILDRLPKPLPKCFDHFTRTPESDLFLADCVMYIQLYLQHCFAVRAAESKVGIDELKRRFVAASAQPATSATANPTGSLTELAAACDDQLGSAASLSGSRGSAPISHEGLSIETLLSMRESARYRLCLDYCRIVQHHGASLNIAVERSFYDHFYALLGDYVKASVTPSEWAIASPHLCSIFQAPHLAAPQLSTLPSAPGTQTSADLGPSPGRRFGAPAPVALGKLGASGTTAASAAAADIALSGTLSPGPDSSMHGRRMSMVPPGGLSRGGGGGTLTFDALASGGGGGNGGGTMSRFANIVNQALIFNGPDGGSGSSGSGGSSASGGPSGGPAGSQPGSIGPGGGRKVGGGMVVGGPPGTSASASLTGAPTTTAGGGAATTAGAASSGQHPVMDLIARAQERRRQFPATARRLAEAAAAAEASKNGNTGSGGSAGSPRGSAAGRTGSISKSGSATRRGSAGTTSGAPSSRRASREFSLRSVIHARSPLVATLMPTAHDRTVRVIEEGSDIMAAAAMAAMGGGGAQRRVGALTAAMAAGTAASRPLRAVSSRRTTTSTTVTATTTTVSCPAPELGPTVFAPPTTAALRVRTNTMTTPSSSSLRSALRRGTTTTSSAGTTCATSTAATTTGASAAAEPSLPRAMSPESVAHDGDTGLSNSMSSSRSARTASLTTGAVRSGWGNSASAAAANTGAPSVSAACSAALQLAIGDDPAALSSLAAVSLGDFVEAIPI